MSCRRWRALAALPLEVERVRLEGLSLPTHAGWTRHSTVVRLEGGGTDGVGEDVAYSERDQRALQARGGGAFADLVGGTTLEEWSYRLDGVALFEPGAERVSDRLHRRWAFESAALDLALRQAGRSLGDVLALPALPVRWVVSLGLGDPPSPAPLERLLERDPTLRFKVDYAASWTEPLIEALGTLGAVDVVDLKGHYRGAFSGPPPHAGHYRTIAEALPEAWIEDPWLDDETGPALDPHRARVTWDAVLHSWADLELLPFAPRCVNVKPSRFGLLSELLRFHAACDAAGIAAYGGGQFELGPGRAQIQHLASLLYADAPNDVAPEEFNRHALPADLPRSPLPARWRPGFGRVVPSGDAGRPQ